MQIPYEEVQLISNGVYEAVVEKAEDSSSDYGPQVKFTFRYTHPNLRHLTVPGWASKKLNPKTKLFKWVTSLGIKVEKGMVLETESLRNIPCLITVGVAKNGEYNVVEDVNPLTVPVQSYPPQTYQHQPQAPIYSQPQVSQSLVNTQPPINVQSPINPQTPMTPPPNNPPPIGEQKKKWSF